MATEPQNSLLIVIPTYNERENLLPLIERIHANVSDAHLLIVDDDSPDGTGTLADSIAAQEPYLHVLHRKTKDGLGRAYLAGFEWGLAHGYQRFVQMDADLSHDPAFLPALLAAAETYPLVLGSRYVAGGGIENWNLPRRILSLGGSLYARWILGIPLRDLTGGFKCWHRALLEDIDLPDVRSTGYTFQIEMTYRAYLRGYSIAEVPIVFPDRVAGTSKMSMRIALEAVGRVWQLRLNRKQIQQKKAVLKDTAESATTVLPVTNAPVDQIP